MGRRPSKDTVTQVPGTLVLPSDKNNPGFDELKAPDFIRWAVAIFHGS